MKQWLGPCFDIQCLTGIYQELIMKLSALKVSMITLAVAMAGCASTSDLDAARAESAAQASEALAAAKTAQQTADAALKAAAEAKQIAEAAKQTASDANGTAQEARQLAEDANTKIDRSFKKAMYK